MKFMGFNVELLQRASEKRQKEERVEKERQEVRFNDELKQYLDGKVEFEKLSDPVQQAVFFYECEKRNVNISDIEKRMQSYIDKWTGN